MTMTDEGVSNTDQVDVDRPAQQRDLSMENICKVQGRYALQHSQISHWLGNVSITAHCVRGGFV